MRAAWHAALGDAHRLEIVDLLAWSDHTVSELRDLTGIAGNLLAHHLGVLERAGHIDRKISEGDRRRRYVALRLSRRIEQQIQQKTHNRGDFEDVLFVCTHNSARSQFAAALWEVRTGRTARSAGTQPAESVHPGAVRAAAERGIDLSDAVPSGYGQIEVRPDLVVSVCDRAREAPLPSSPAYVHWAVPDPATAGSSSAFRVAFDEIEQRIARLAKVQAGTGGSKE